MTVVGGGWRIERRRGSARQFVDQATTLAGGGDGGGRQVRIRQVDGPAVVLGSSQPDSDIDLEAAAAAGVEVVRRRSGGGAVFLEPGAVVWVDVIIPAGDPLWDADVVRAAWWVGDAWATALEAVGAGPAQVRRGGLRASAWSKRVCFGGLGPGEVCVDGRKAVGISQRRTRQAALFQTAALLSWDPVPLLRLLRIDEAARAQAAVDLATAATGIGPARAAAVLDAWLDALPS